MLTMALPMHRGPAPPEIVRTSLSSPGFLRDRTQRPELQERLDPRWDGPSRDQDPLDALGRTVDLAMPVRQDFESAGIAAGEDSMSAAPVRREPNRIENRNRQLRPRATYKVHLSILGHLCLYTYISDRTTEVVRHKLRSLGGLVPLGSGSNRAVLFAAT